MPKATTFAEASTVITLQARHTAEVQVVSDQPAVAYYAQEEAAPLLAQGEQCTMVNAGALHRTCHSDQTTPTALPQQPPSDLTAHSSGGFGDRCDCTVAGDPWSAYN